MLHTQNARTLFLGANKITYNLLQKNLEEYGVCTSYIMYYNNNNYYYINYISYILNYILLQVIVSVSIMYNNYQ